VSRPSIFEWPGGDARLSISNSDRRGVRMPPGLYSDFARSNAAGVRHIISMKIIL